MENYIRLPMGKLFLCPQTTQMEATIKLPLKYVFSYYRQTLLMISPTNTQKLADNGKFLNVKNKSHHLSHKSKP
jgi:hypothetical protein